MSCQIGPGLATRGELHEYFGVGPEKAAEILNALGLPPGRLRDWTTVWSALGLAPVQKRRLWDELRLPLMDVAAAADVAGRRPATVRGWCDRGEFPPGFPPPFVFGPRTRRWIGLELRAWRQPAVYDSIARGIKRPPRSARKVLQPPAGPVPTTLEPMPSS